MRLRVVWGLGEIIASFSPTSAFSIVDLPALGRPRMQTKPERNGIGNKLRATGLLACDRAMINCCLQFGRCASHVYGLRRRACLLVNGVARNLQPVAFLKSTSTVAAAAR